MATDQERTDSSNTPFPNPPLYWQAFTTDNIAAYESLRTRAETGPRTDIPDELKYLRPPSPPPNGEYKIFGEARSLEAPQPELPEETPLLQPAAGTGSSPQHLLNLTRSLMLSYLELLHVMAVNPDPAIYGIKWEDLRDLFQNAHHGLNAYRPWQARDALIRLLEQTKNNARKQIEGVHDLKAKVDRVLQEVGLNCEQVAIGVEERLEHDPNAMNGIETNGHEKKAAVAGNDVAPLSNEEIQDSGMWSLINEESEE